MSAAEQLLSPPESKTGRLQQACFDLLRQHDRRDEIPINGRFIFYELEQAGVIPKNYAGINPKTGKEWARTPMQDVSRALMHLREHGLIPWAWLEDETRSLSDWRYAANVVEFLINSIDRARIDLWQGEEPPLIICREPRHYGCAAQPRVPVPCPDHPLA